jgi:hypothetical protein
MRAVIVNSVGLIFDIAGAVLLFRFGLPADVRRSGHSYLVINAEDPNEKAKARGYDRWGRVGLALLCLGFALQFASNFMR